MKKHSHLFYDIMFPLWHWYHRWILHPKGFPWFANCGHRNPYDVLTPRRFRKQIEQAMKNW